ncbi:MAG TPA: cytochrome c biogenesis protein CcsA [Longimicrobiales bacterium]
MPNGSGAVAPAPKWVGRFALLALVFFVFAQATAVYFSPADRDMGHLQKIMYVHVPAAWVAFAAFGAVAVYSALYLWKRAVQYDLVAASAAEVGTVFTALTIVLGSIWGKPTWGVWWTWDPRLTTTAILLLIFVGYVALRSFTDDDERRARWSAAVGILGAINVPIVFMSVRWWRTIHQVQSSPQSIDKPYAYGLLINTLAFTLIGVVCIAHRYFTARVERAVEQHVELNALEEVEV